MNLQAVKHIPKSNMAYAADENNLHVYLQTAKGDATKVELIIGDPFDWKIQNEVYLWSGKYFPRQTMTKAYETELFDYYFIDVVTTNKRSKYSFILHQDNRVWFYGCHFIKELVNETDALVVDQLAEYFNFPYINKEDLIDSPAWSKSTIWYQIFPDRFHKSSGNVGNYLPFGSVTDKIKNNMFFGGDLNGVTEKIPYLSDLGITGIYFTPLFKAYSAHKYDTEDYFTIDPTFGTNADFKTMVEACHKAGIKVMLDGVFNHCGWDHPFFQDVIKNGKKSPYWDCFFIESEDFVNFPLDAFGRPAVHNLSLKYRTFAKTPFMPKLNTGNPLMERYLLDIATYWVREYDIDGWRLDVSNEVSHSFWRKFRQAVRSVKPDTYIIGENWDDSNSWLRGDQFDAVMNYEVSYPVWQFLAKVKNPNPISAESFASRINSLLVSYPKVVNVNMFNLVGSHDTMRLLTRMGNDSRLVKLAYLFIFSFCGSPAIYYGDEVGLEGKEDPDCRRCMLWNEGEQDKTLYAFFKRIIAIRKQNRDFELPDIRWHQHSENVLVYQKGDTLLFLNNNPEPKTIAVPEPVQQDVWKNLMTGRQSSIPKKITLAEYGFLVTKL